MNFYTAQDLRATPESILENLPVDREIVITSGGKPRALLLDISNEDLEETLKAIRRAKAMMVFDSMRLSARGDHDSVDMDSYPVKVHEERPFIYTRGQ